MQNLANMKMHVVVYCPHSKRSGKKSRYMLSLENTKMNIVVYCLLITWESQVKICSKQKTYTDCFPNHELEAGKGPGI